MQSSEVYSKPVQIPKMKKAFYENSLTIFAKSFNLDVLQGFECTFWSLYRLDMNDIYQLFLK